MEGLDVIWEGFAVDPYIAGLPCGLKSEGAGARAEMSALRCFCLLGRCSALGDSLKIEMLPESLS